MTCLSICFYFIGVASALTDTNTKVWLVNFWTYEDLEFGCIDKQVVILVEFRDDTS